MKQGIVFIVAAAIMVLTGLPGLRAQGQLSGSFETRSIYYLDDSETKAFAPEDNPGSNNYLKLDYGYGKFSAGVQYEAYLPVVQGLPTGLHNSGLVLKYASFRDSSLTVTAGDFYEQFGNGLILRTYEERSLGLNTAIEGVRVDYSFGSIARIKGFAGRPREFMEKAGSVVKGASLHFDLASLLQLKSSSLTAEANYVNRYVRYAGQAGIDPNVNAWSLRGNWIRGAVSLQGEYAYKTKDAAAYSGDIKKDGSAFLLELGYNANGFGSLLSVRRLEYMQFGTSRGIAGIGRDLNFLPALTRQYSYSLANLQPHNTMGNGETGGQLDIRYRFKRGTSLGGRYGTRISLNASAYYNLKGDVANGYDFFAIGSTRYYRDINVDVEKKISQAVNLHLVYSAQAYNPVVIGKENTQHFSNIAVADLTWKATDSESLRFEGQHLWSREYYKNWTAGLVEYTIASTWSFFAGDMYNYGDTGIHYYNTGCSYTASRTRFSLSYGRNREGVICVGGICLLMPAYTGFNLSVTSSF